jgi:hypothetical protein
VYSIMQHVHTCMDAMRCDENSNFLPLPRAWALRRELGPSYSYSVGLGCGGWVMWCHCDVLF